MKGFIGQVREKGRGTIKQFRLKRKCSIWLMGEADPRGPDMILELDSDGENITAKFFGTDACYKVVNVKKTATGCVLNIKKR